MNELERVKELFLTDVDPETYQENLEIITKWEEGILHNESYAEWKDHHITRYINTRLKEAYLEHATALATNRNLSESERLALWAKQDAISFLMQHTAKDAAAEHAAILGDIRRRLWDMDTSA